MYYNKLLSLSILKIIIVIYPTCLGTKEPKDEQLCKAVLILINIYIKLLDLVKQLNNTPTTVLHNMGAHLGHKCKGYKN